MNREQHQVAADLQTKSQEFSCRQLASTPIIAFSITQTGRRLSFYCPTESKRLSWPRHCSKGMNDGRQCTLPLNWHLNVSISPTQTSQTLNVDDLTLTLQLTLWSHVNSYNCTINTWLLYTDRAVASSPLWSRSLKNNATAVGICNHRSNRQL